MFTSFVLSYSKQTSKQTNKQTSKQTNKQAKRKRSLHYLRQRLPNFLRISRVFKTGFTACLSQNFQKKTRKTAFPLPLHDIFYN